MSDIESSLCEPDLHFHFVKPGDDEKSEEPADLAACFEKIVERFNSVQQSTWVTEKECMKCIINSLTKKDVFVFCTFDGLAFEHIQRSNALVLGPPVMLSCLNSNAYVPNVKSPIFSDAMRDLVICTSGLNSAEKVKINTLVNYMGGNFENSLSSDSTHLVTKTVMSSKYEKAIAFKMQTLLPEWVLDCWNLCQNRLINAATDELHYKYKIPVFNNINITTTGIDIKRREKLSTLIKENGGKHHSSFKSEMIDILILDRNQKMSDKFKAAIKCKKVCLTPAWITDSVAKGFALPVADYRVDDGSPNLQISTPNKDLTTQPPFSGDCTSISEISCISTNVTVNETVVGRSKSNENNESANGIQKSYKLLLANIQVKEAKAAGPFLDGCNIFVCGFNGEEKEKLSKILTSGSAIHFNDFNAIVDHVIVGNPNATEQSFLRSVSCIMVTLGWLTESLQLRQPAAENLHIYRLPVTAKVLDDEKTAHASPASKKNIQSMSGTFRRPMIPKKLDMNFSKIEQQNREENTLLMQYAKAAETLAPVQAATTTTNLPSENTRCDSTAPNRSFLAGLKFFFQGFIDESNAVLISDVENAGGEIVTETYSGVIDYLILAMDIMQYDLEIRTKNIVNELWLIEASNTGNCVPVEYYHHPILMNEDVRPLDGLNLVFSIYSGLEREYLVQLAAILGAEVNSKYVKSDNPILLCPKQDGAKYMGAVKWELPVVTKDWLLACFEKRKKVPFPDYFPQVAPNAKSNSNESKVSTLPKRSSQRVTRRTASLQGATQTQGANQSQAEKKSKTTNKLETVQQMNPEISNEVAEELPISSTPRRVKSAIAETPKLRHNRISELNAMSPFMSQSPGNDEDALRRFLTCPEISTPEREIMFDKVKAYVDSETPVTRQRRMAMGTPDTPKLPKELFSPYKQELAKKREDEFWKSRQIPKQPRVQTPPFSEVAKKFWKNVLGYTPSPDMSQSQSQSLQNTCSTLQPINSVATVVSNQVAPTVVLAAAADEHVQRLSKYIENARDVSRSPKLPTRIQESAPVNATEEFEMHIDVETQVGWRDPTDFHQSNRFVNRKGIQHKGTPRFAISCSDKNHFDRMDTLIRKLNGEVTENTTAYDPTCTHVLCEYPSRSEKVFSAIAAGKWILKTSYIDDSSAAGEFLNEELYEWGNPKAEEDMETVSLTGRAAHRWRKRLQAQGEPAPFSEFKAIVHSKKEKIIRNLIEAGGGVFIEASEPYCTSKHAANATHCFTDGKSKLSDTDVSFFKKNNVLLLSFSYLEAYINSEPWPPSISRFVV